MKKVLITFLLVLSTMSCFAKKVYCIAEFYTIGVVEETTYIKIDYGDGNGFVGPIKDKDGMFIKASTKAELLNAMSELGWEYIPGDGSFLFFKEIK